MLEFKLIVGLTGSIETKVFKKDTAEFYGSGKLDVYATPAMVALMEGAALSAVELHLPIGLDTIGMSINVNHLKSTPIGMKVRATAELIKVEGRKLLFKVQAFDEVDKIGEGYHERYIVEAQKFKDKTNLKLKEALDLNIII